jgi:hypothetical protein
MEVWEGGAETEVAVEGLSAVQEIADRQVVASVVAAIANHPVEEQAATEGSAEMEEAVSHESYSRSAPLSLWIQTPQLVRQRVHLQE